MKIIDDLVQAFTGLEYSYVDSTDIDPFRKRKIYLLNELNRIASEIRSFADMNSSISGYFGLLDLDKQAEIIERSKKNIVDIIQSLIEDYKNLACTPTMSQEIIVEYKYYFFRRARIVPLFSRFYCWNLYYALQQISFFLYYCFERYPESQPEMMKFVNTIQNLRL